MGIRIITVLQKKFGNVLSVSVNVDVLYYDFVGLIFSWIDESISSIIYLVPENLTFIPYILLVMLTSMSLVHIPRFSNSRILLVEFFFSASILIFKS